MENNCMIGEPGLSGMMAELTRVADSDYFLSRLLRIQAQGGCCGMDFIYSCALYVWMTQTDCMMDPDSFLEMLILRHGIGESQEKLRELICRKLEMMIEEEREVMFESLES